VCQLNFYTEHVGVMMSFHSMKHRTCFSTSLTLFIFIFMRIELTLSCNIINLCNVRMQSIYVTTTFILISQHRTQRIILFMTLVIGRHFEVHVAVTVYVVFL
jgi:hypothetical protein